MKINLVADALSCVSTINSSTVTNDVLAKAETSDTELQQQVRGALCLSYRNLPCLGQKPLSTVTYPPDGPDLMCTHYIAVASSTICTTSAILVSTPPCTSWLTAMFGLHAAWLSHLDYWLKSALSANVPKYPAHHFTTWSSLQAIVPLPTRPPLHHWAFSTSRRLLLMPHINQFKPWGLNWLVSWRCPQIFQLRFLSLDDLVVKKIVQLHSFAWSLETHWR